MELIKNKQIVNIILYIFYISELTVTLFYNFVLLYYKSVSMNLLMKKYAALSIIST